MTRVYLDASVLFSLFVSDAHTNRACNFFVGQAWTPIVSDFAAAEVSSALGRQIRMQAMTEAEARTALTNFDEWRRGFSQLAETSTADIVRADRILRRFDLGVRTPDALNISLAERAGALLATFDARMDWCARELGIPVAEI